MEFLNSHAGLAVIGLSVAVVLIVFPPALAWVAATFAVAFTFHHLVLAFRQADAEEAELQTDDA